MDGSATFFAARRDRNKTSAAIQIGQGEQHEPSAPFGLMGTSGFVGPAILVLGVAGLAYAVVTASAPGSGVDVEHLRQHLGAAAVAINGCLALTVAWISLLRHRFDRDLLSGRLALGLPCVVWAVMASSEDGLSIARFMLGVTGTALVLAHVLQPVRAVTHSLAARMGLVVTGVAIGSAVLFLTSRSNPIARARLRDIVETASQPAAWVLLGCSLALAQRLSIRRYRIDRRIVAAVAVCIVSVLIQVIVSPDAEIRRLITSGVMIVALLGFLLSTAGDLCRVVAVQAHRIQSLEIDRRLEDSRRNEEALAMSRKVHDQRAALLSVEAVLRVLEHDGVPERRRLAAAATAELQRLRAPQPNAASEPMLVSVELRALIEPLAAVARAEGARVTIDIRNDLSVKVQPSALIDVVRNLIVNAVDHGGNPRIVIAARRFDLHSVEITVTDDGRGIPAVRKFDLFEPGRSTGGADHSGLGLSSARTLLRSMQGELSLDRSYVDGARFVAHVLAGTD